MAAAFTCLALAVFFCLAFAGTIRISPVAFTLGPFAVRWYGLFALVGLAVGLPWTVRRAQAVGCDPGLAERILLGATVAGLAGARLAYVLQNIPWYAAHPDQILRIADGGLAVHGMLAGGVLGAALLCRAYRQPFWALADAAAPALLLGMVIGRFGNFTNGELIGYPTTLPWKMFVAPEYRPAGYLAAAFFHPIFLYDALLNGLALFVLLRRERSAVVRGEVFWRFLAAISLTRLVVEHWRINVPASTASLSSAQLLSIGLGTAAVAVIAAARRGALPFERIR